MSVRLDHGDDGLADIHEINVTPFIDVMLVLLIIFMVAAPLATVDVAVNLPTAAAQAQPRPPMPQFLTVKADLTLALGDEAVERDALGGALDAATKGDRDARIFLRADKSVSYGSLMEVMNLVRAAGYLKIALVGLEEGAGPVIALSAQDRRELIRWLSCGMVVLFAHAGVAAALIEWREPVEDGEVGTDAIVVEFQPEQIQTDPTPQPVEKVEEKPEPLPEQQSEAILPQQPEVPPEPPHDEVPFVPVRPQQARAEVATWRSQIVTILEHNKRYPAEARARGEHGVTRLAFSIDGNGRLLSSRVVASSGSAALDAETLELVRRAQPFPPPPPEVAGSELTVPLNFSIR